MTCASCGQENPAGARFCNGCGTTLESLCPRCGKPNPPGSRFCNGCGGQLQAAAIANRVADPRAYTPKHLAEKILTIRSALEGERKQVTVVVRGTLSEVSKDSGAPARLLEVERLGSDLRLRSSSPPWSAPPPRDALSCRILHSEPDRRGELRRLLDSLGFLVVVACA